MKEKCKYCGIVHSPLAVLIGKNRYDHGLKAMFVTKLVTVQRLAKC